MPQCRVLESTLRNRKLSVYIICLKCPLWSTSRSTGLICYWRDLEWRLRQTANVNLYHVTKSSLYLRFTVHYFYPIFVASFCCWIYCNNCLVQFLSACFLFWESLNLILTFVTSVTLRLRANRRNIVGCYMLRPFAHPFACCWMLLCFVAQSLKPVKLFSQQLPTFLLFRDCRSVAQHCWGHARSLRMVYRDLWVVSFPRCTVGPNNTGSCCIRLHTTANTDATTPNIVGATMLGVAASVCTQP